MLNASPVGWSLGGALSLEMAHQIATQPSGDGSADRRPRFNVLGMVWVDTQCPRPASEVPALADKHLPAEVVQRARAELDALKLLDKVGLNMLNARIMIQAWEKPAWREAPVPPTILLRARDRYAADPSSTFVDHQRGNRMLGWEAYSAEHDGFLKEVVDVDGHHFSVFEEQNVSFPLSFLSLGVPLLFTLPLHPNPLFFLLYHGPCRNVYHTFDL